jgi:hypothetical protein
METASHQLLYDRYLEHRELVKYILCGEFKNRYFLEILELMKALVEVNGVRGNEKPARRMAARLFELAKIFRDTYTENPGQSEAALRFNIDLSRSYSRYAAAYDCDSWDEKLRLMSVFYYPYPIPEKLIWASLGNPGGSLRYAVYPGGRGAAESGRNGQDIITLIRKWLDSLLNGGPGPAKTKLFSTKVEAVYFLVYMRTADSIVRAYFYAKCKGRHIHNSIADHAAGVFARKFARHFNHPLVAGFLDLIARTGEKELYLRGNMRRLDDIGDFVLAKIAADENAEQKEPPFSFKGRTLKSVIRLMNEWHISLLNDIDGAGYAGNPDIPFFPRDLHFRVCKWDGLGMRTCIYETTDCTWIVTELRNSMSLYLEGQWMKNCVVTYSDRCAAGECAIFTLSCKNKKSKEIEKMATLEVRAATKTLVQAKGKYNAPVTDDVRAIIMMWAKANSIAVAVS